METIERSLVLFKPDAIERGLVGEILQRFERVGLKIIGMKMLQPTQSHAESHYREDIAIRHGENVRNTMIKMLTGAPIVAIVLEGIQAVEVIRKMIGSTQPIEAAPGTIRGDYAHVSFKHANREPDGNLYNLVHGSATLEEAKMEIAIWFTEDELVAHDPVYTKHTLA